VSDFTVYITATREGFMTWLQGWAGAAQLPGYALLPAAYDAHCDAPGLLAVRLHAAESAGDGLDDPAGRVLGPVIGIRALDIGGRLQVDAVALSELPGLRGLFDAFVAGVCEAYEVDRPPAAGVRPGGRPSDPDSDWAFEQLENGRNQSEVFDEWMRRKGPNAELLADPMHDFKQAIRYRRGRRRKSRK